MSTKNNIKFLNGKYLDLYKNGKLFSIINYKNDELHGVLQYWYNNGILWIEKTYKNGKLNGPCKSWWDNGNIYCEYMCINDKRHGVYKEYNREGKILKYSFYIDGEEEITNYNINYKNDYFIIIETMKELMKDKICICPIDELASTVSVSFLDNKGNSLCLYCYGIKFKFKNRIYNL